MESFFCPASGRQYYNLLERFEPIAERLIFIAENGSYVVRGGAEIGSECLARDAAHELIGVARGLAAAGSNCGVVLCGKRSAYIERGDPDFLAQVDRYYHRLARVDDLLSVDDSLLKLAIYDFDSSERRIYPAFARFRSTHQVVVSSANWLDVMALQANKGAGLRRIQQALGVSREQTMVFGDFLNDLEMMDEAAYSFAMANAHPLLKQRARFLAPGNADNGVVRTIKSVLAIA